MTAARELIAEETVLREAEKIPAIKNPARPEKNNNLTESKFIQMAGKCTIWAMGVTTRSH